MKALSFTLALTLAAIGNCANAQDSSAVSLHIVSATLADAINQWAQQTGFRVVWTEDVSSGTVVSQLEGTFTPRQALERLLRNTHLKVEFPDAQTAVISKEQSLTAARRPAPVRLADSTAAMPFIDADSGGASSDEVIVTAQKKTERLQDVPVAVTALNPEVLAESGQTRLADYFTAVPGLTLLSNADGPGTQYLVIRGLSTGLYQNSTVSTVIDDVPTGSSTELSFGQMSPSDIDPSDLDHIEVLKGPQGTLYGADSLGGLVKYVTKDPSTTAFSGRVEVGGIDVPDGGLGYVTRAAANVPVSDVFAIRVSGYARRDPGYIDDVTTAQKNVNSANVYGGHLATLWKPADDVSLKLSALVQKTNGNGSDQIDSNSLGRPTLGKLQQTGLPGTGPYTTENQLYSGTLKAKVAELDLVSVTGYGVTQFDSRIDLTGSYGPSAAALIGVSSAAEDNRFKTDKFSQELRVSASIGHWVDWLAGAFYTHERSPEAAQNIYAASQTGQVAGTLILFDFTPPVTLSEYAVFGDFTTHITDWFDIQLGGRESWNKIDYSLVATGPLTDGFYHVTRYVQPPEHADGNAFTYLVTPELKISPDLMVYARVASGYRVGGPNPTGLPGYPTSYKPDTTVNYELGIKGELLEKRLTFDAAAYYIDWSDFQIGETGPGGHFFEGNAGKAKSEGLEASLQLRPVAGLTIAAQGSYNDAQLTQNLPAAVVAGGTYGLAGAQLPYSVRWSGGLTLNQDIDLSAGWTGFVGGAVTYLGSRPGEFASSYAPPYARLEFPAFTTVNLRTGARHDSWLLNFYVNNAGNRRGITGITPSYGATAGYYTTIIQPRTVGVDVVYTF